MPGLRDFLNNVDTGVTSTGDEAHIGVALLEHIIAVVEALDVIAPSIATGTATTVGFATVSGVALGSRVRYSA